MIIKKNVMLTIMLVFFSISVKKIKGTKRKSLLINRSICSCCHVYVKYGKRILFNTSFSMALVAFFIFVTAVCQKPSCGLISMRETAPMRALRGSSLTGAAWNSCCLQTVIMCASVVR